MPAIHGRAPVDLGLVNLAPTEMMFWLYCPIKLPDSIELVVPDNLKQFMPIVTTAIQSCDQSYERYIYLTAKTVWVTNENPAQRRGWHCDGYGTDDINFIWYDRCPTLFKVLDRPVEFDRDHNIALKQMEAVANSDIGRLETYPSKHLLRLDEGVLHRVGDDFTPGMRSFVKVSISRHPFNLVGNSINHDLDVDWSYGVRSEDRNPEVAHLTDHKDPHLQDRMERM